MARSKLPTLHQGEIIVNTDEPFYVLECRNAYAPTALRALINVLNNAGDNQAQLAAIDVSNALDAMVAWQANNHTEVLPPVPMNTGSIPGLNPEDFAEPQGEDE